MNRLNLILMTGAAMASTGAFAGFGSFMKQAAQQTVQSAVQPAATTAVPSGAATAPASKVKMAEYYVKNAEKGSRRVGNQAAIDARQRVNDLKQSYADDPAVVALDQRLKKVEDEINGVKAEYAADEKAAKARKAAEAEAVAATQVGGGHSAALPWVMEQTGNIYKQEREKKFDDYISKLGVAKKPDVVALINQLKARVEEDRKIVAANASGMIKAQEELECYDEFLSRMWDNVLRLNLDAKVDAEANSIQLTSYRIMIPTSSVLLMWCERDKLHCFSDPDTKESDYVYDEKAVNAIKFHLNQLYYISCFCYGQKDPGHKKTYAVSWFLVEKISEALKNNTKDRMVYHPRPVAGKMHGEFGKEALKLAQNHEFFQGATEAVVCSNDWTIDRDRFGNIIRRCIEGEVLKPTGPGVRLLKAKWAQDYQGGGKYGKLKLFTWGGKRYWVK